MSNEIEALAAWHDFQATYHYNEAKAKHQQTAQVLRQLQAENERLHTLAKANNDLARHEASGRRELQSENAALKARVEALEGALDPNQTKAAYMGEFAFPVEDMDEDGNEYTRKQYVPWTTIKEIMAAILTRAAPGIPHAE
jgi:DNA repair exonuclease SbcCD ATPase subunit